MNVVDVSYFSLKFLCLGTRRQGGGVRGRWGRSLAFKDRRGGVSWEEVGVGGGEAEVARVSGGAGGGGVAKLFSEAEMPITSGVGTRWAETWRLLCLV